MKYSSYINFRGLALLLVLAGFSSCEDPIDIDLADPIPQLTVDAFVTDQVQTQTVRLTTSQQYFAESFNPAATGATVVMRNETRAEEFVFTDPDGDGSYTFENLAVMPLVKLGDVYTLKVTYNGENYEASSLAKRNVPIDSISYELREEELGQEEGYYAQLHARDSSGDDPDFYRIRTWKLDASTGARFWLNKPGEISVSADGTFDPGARNNDLPLFEFILPIRESINPDIDEELEEAPYELGDSLFVELHSIDQPTFIFFQQLQEQTNNGGLFATPLSNVLTNIRNLDSTATVSEQAVGWFGVSLVSSAGKRIE